MKSHSYSGDASAPGADAGWRPSADPSGSLRPLLSMMLRQLPKNLCFLWQAMQAQQRLSSLKVKPQQRFQWRWRTTLDDRILNLSLCGIETNVRSSTGCRESSEHHLHHPWTVSKSFKSLSPNDLEMIVARLKTRNLIVSF